MIIAISSLLINLASKSYSTSSINKQYSLKQLQLPLGLALLIKLQHVVETNESTNSFFSHPIYIYYTQTMTWKLDKKIVIRQYRVSDNSKIHLYLFGLGITCTRFSSNGSMNHNKSDATQSYVAQFRFHQKFVQAHLKGTLIDEQPLLPAFFPPSSYWSSDEKDLFFHGLAMYSRFRPDLIAESIKTKTIFDVCLYLDILQTASSPIPSGIHGSFRSSLEPAMEVSGRWIQNEEQLAAELIQFDSCTPGPEEGQLGEVDSAAVPLPPTPDSFEQPAVQVEGSCELSLVNKLASLLLTCGICSQFGFT